MMVVVRQASGLGNQLFQYAAGRYLARKYNATLCVAHEMPQRQWSGSYPRPYLLSKFSIEARVRQATLLDRLLSSGYPSAKVLSWPVDRLIRSRTIRESKVGLPPVVELTQHAEMAGALRTLYITGYWQAHSIVHAVEDDLRREFTLREPLRGQNLQTADKIASAGQSVSLHLRRGDYSPGHLLPTEFYDRAIQFLRERYHQVTVFVFSDDPMFARQWIDNRSGFVMVNHNDANTGFEDLRLMSLCRHNVIANSTFSWWGAWLNPKADKQVIVPSKWTTTQTIETELVVPGWTIINSGQRSSR